MCSIKTLATRTLAAQTPTSYVGIDLKSGAWSTYFLTNKQVKDAKKAEVVFLFLKPTDLGLSNAFITTLETAREAEANLMARPIHLERELGELVGLRVTIKMYESVLKAVVKRYLEPM